MGAISNGLELLNMAQRGSSPELELISDSIQNATTRLRFFRITFGAVSEDQGMSRAEILSVLKEMDKLQKQSIRWDSQAEFSRRRVKLIFLLIMCLETALPWGGEIRIEDCDGGVHLTGLSERLKIDDELWSALWRGHSQVPITSARVHFAIAMAEIAAQAARLSVTQDHAALRLSLRFAV
ncbi:histidine phosphotransferase family protein [Natronohydrobacter thiooxidans]|jgi:histidine phosphotransferase ChpT|uniref:histidine phosphotransferase family protein n=1 Tax=Natronohydrobacter thiooxidans TaxID=87172 RepID=UPI001587A606|nr:histidine phosphotransferase family protein [Natronohydrobacter thiooxidans]